MSGRKHHFRPLAVLVRYTERHGALLTYDNEGRLTAWQNIALVTTTPTSTPALEEALYDGEGQRIEQIDVRRRSEEHDSSVSNQLYCSMRERVFAQIGH